MRDRAFTLAAYRPPVSDEYAVCYHGHRIGFAFRRAFTKLRALRAFAGMLAASPTLAEPLYHRDAKGLLANALARFAALSDGPANHTPGIETVEMRRASGDDEPRGQFIITINGSFRCGADPDTWGCPWYECKGIDGKWRSGPHFHGEE